MTHTTRALDTAISRAVVDLAGSPASATSRCQWRGVEGRWTFTFTGLPSENVFPKALLPLRPLVLVLIKDISGAASEPDIQGFATLYGLTPSETRLCSSLAAGRTLLETAAENGISYETARDRIKTVFQKTETRRQAELCTLLGRFRD